MWEQRKRVWRDRGENRVICNIMLLGMLLCVAITASSQTLTVGILVQENAAEVADWQPTLDYLSKTFPGLAFRAKPLGFGELIADLRKRAVDYAILDPAALLAMPEPSNESNGPLRLVAWDPYPSDAAVQARFRELRLPPYDRDDTYSLKQVVRRYAYLFIAAGMLGVVGLAIIITLSSLNHALRLEVQRRLEAEKALLKSIERFEQVASISSDWIWECDEKGVFTYVNANTVPMLGYATHEVLGRTFQDFLSALDREKLAQEGRTLLDENRRVFREQVRMRTKDGRVVVHEITAEPVRDGAGKWVGFRGVNRDITDRVHVVRLMS